MYSIKQKNRRILFGYQIIDGEIAIHEDERKVVQWLYKNYQQGYSYKQLAEILSGKGVPYRAGEKGWNKNMVQRILSREEYCGTAEYSKIIERSKYEEVQSQRKRKADQRAIKTEWPKSIRQKLFCGHCGSKVYREKIGPIVNWQCQMERRTTPDYIGDEILWGKILIKQNELIEEPRRLEIPKEKTYELSLAGVQMNNEILRQIREGTNTEEKMAALIYQAAQERYKGCSSLDATYYTDKLKELYSQRTICSEPDFELIEHSVNRIFLNPDGEIQFEMKNGKLI